ncbi:hypothetical protein EWM64_g5293 [Hericium alpestre]|uniref:Uncharacterized protein n=1 Tax=Hericium alpestre TaxID=135208 RepID=A0A4Y9ZXH5_9AGAM|nr:hypothetical protein EWM64_g5293 [Hericium alpestre]
MSRPQQTFLFSSLDGKTPLTARKVHIRRLYDVFQLCVQRHDRPRARRAWSILVRCKEVDWKDMWKSCLFILGDGQISAAGERDRRAEFLRMLLLRIRMREALDELELYLPSFPYQDNPVLHIYAGLMCLYLAQPAEEGMSPRNIIRDTLLSSALRKDRPFNPSLLRDAQGHLERAKILDPDNIVAQAFLEKLPSIAQPAKKGEDDSVVASDDENSMEVDEEGAARKRMKPNT